MTVLKRALQSLLLLTLCFIMLILGALLGGSNPAPQSAVITSTEYVYNGLTGQQTLDLIPLQGQQLLTCQLQASKGIVDLWLESDSGERQPPSLVTYQFAVPAASTYHLLVSGKDASFTSPQRSRSRSASACRLQAGAFSVDGFQFTRPTYPTQSSCYDALITRLREAYTVSPSSRGHLRQNAYDPRIDIETFLYGIDPVGQSLYIDGIPRGSTH